MKIEIGITRYTAAWGEEMKKAAQGTLLKMGHQGEVFLKPVGQREIKKLNGELRGKAAVTDVLSFPVNAFQIQDGRPHLLGGYVMGEHGIVWGDIVLCIPRALAQAKAYGHDPRREVAYLTVHGMLHLMGYDHETAGDKTVMRAMEEGILSYLARERSSLSPREQKGL